MRQIDHFIDGRHVAGVSGRQGDVFDPNSGSVQARVPLATAAELDAAVAGAVAAQREWAAVNPQRRARVMFEFKRLLEADMDALAGLQGNPRVVTGNLVKADHVVRHHPAKLAELCLSVHKDITKERARA